jgi:hypothetical protein
MPMSSSARVRKRRLALRKAGLRPVQLWVPDTRKRGFAAECRRQSRIAAPSDRRDGELLRFMDAVLDDLPDGSA